MPDGFEKKTVENLKPVGTSAGVNVKMPYNNSVDDKYKDHSFETNYKTGSVRTPQMNMGP
jgi:hypothetical protein